MLKFIKSPRDTLAVKLSGMITGEDLDAIMDRTDAIMAENEKINLYVETHAITGLQVSAMPHHMNRAFPLFGKLGRFGRVAVVADQAWMRIATRIESALLPNIRYRVYEPEERSEALEWALGKVLVDA